MFKLLTIFIGLLSVFGKISAVSAETTAPTRPQFAMPIDCKLGETCWIANYVDVDPTSGVKDFKCNDKSYDGHKGVDFALKSRSAMNKGVNVLAAMDGKVLRVRGGENDDPKTKEEYDAITQANKDCGNGIILDHGLGVQSFYCHLKNGSIAVKPGQSVKEGDILGQVGQSGFAEFPHLHFTALWEGGHVDPFTGMLKEDGCGKVKQSLWKDDIPYAPYALFDAGFAGKVPDFKALNEGGQRPQEPNLTSKAFVFWVSLYQMQKGSQVTLRITDPEGKTFINREITQDKNRARQHYYTGRKLRDRTLKSGTYSASVTLKAKGYEPHTQEFTIDIQ